jgi:hypothetical protein
MKVTVEVDCTPEEARRFLGLPDVSKANDVYVESVAKQVAPMGEIGLKLFQNFMEQGGLGAMSGSSKKPKD